MLVFYVMSWVKLGTFIYLDFFAVKYIFYFWIYLAMPRSSVFDTQSIPLKNQRSNWLVKSLAEKALVLCEKVENSASLVVYLADDSAQASQLEEFVGFYNLNQQGSSRFEVLSFPDWETLPYDHFSPHQDIISQRLKSLYRLPSLQRGLLILPISTFLQRVVPQSFIEKLTFILSVNQTLDIGNFTAKLERGGYQRSSQVIEPGYFAIRGSIIDVFPMGSKTPFRLDLFDDEVESIKSFDTETQRTIQEIGQIEMLPAKEYDLTEDGVLLFKQNFKTSFGDDSRSSQLYKSVNERQTLDGLEYYLPLFHQQVATLGDYLPLETLFFDDGNLSEQIKLTWDNYQERFDIAQHNPDYPVLKPEQLIQSEPEVFSALKKYHRISFSGKPSKDISADFNTKSVPDLSIQNKSDYPLAKLNAFLDQYGGRVLFSAESTGRRESLLDILRKEHSSLQPVVLQNWVDFQQSSHRLQIVVSPLEDSLLTDEFCIVSEAQIFGTTVIQKRRRSKAHNDFSASISSLVELEVGNPIVHIDHGVGRYLGLETLVLQGEAQELLTIAYAGESKLYVPVTSLHLISRYTGANADTAPMHKLGSDRWEKAKKKAAEKVHDVAAELLDIYAQREAISGFAFNTESQDYDRFVASFPFEETPDQASAIDNVIADMKKDKPMDRLICGDVGFGKTEVAMRAAFIAAYSGKQVAVLVPTTLLSQQHLENFRDRFADWPISIAGLSRFQSAKEAKQILVDAREGKVDIVIGTHKLIQKEALFKNLGLIIIDEEHRFGVRQKEQLKKMRAEVDVMTMTATPIPRTLNMAMNDLRDLSIIATPPAKRLAVETFVQEWNTDTAKEACLREIRRGGQIYILFNNVDRINKMAEDIRELIPEAKVSVAHGQMNEKELEQVMHDFYHRRFNILVCTTIIETGIDIPTANTILIHRADKFGLAQLHQLRGRVGRSHHKAYAYLFTAGKSLMTKDAAKRLDAITKHNTLGAGFMLASHDLEIRGAGELLGDGQSGQIAEIGFTLYSELLDRAVKSLQSGNKPEVNLQFKHGVEVELGVPSLIPEDYLPDIHSRLVFYKRIASAKNKNQLNELEVEMIDRFGLLPTQVKNLFSATEIKLLAEPLNLTKIDAHEKQIRILFNPQSNIDGLKLVQLIQRYPKNYALKGQTELKYFDTMLETVERTKAIELIITSIRE